MYSVKLDEQGYFTGAYAKTGGIPGGIKVSHLPENMNKVNCYKYGAYEVKEEVEVPLIDTETGEQKRNEEGKLIFGKKKITHQEIGWWFDEEKATRLQQEKEVEEIRKQRDQAFKRIDKYQLVLVYEDLTLEEKEALAAYRKAWLDAPETRSMPIAPIWLE